VLRLALGVAPTDQRVVYLADALVDERVELFSVPADGSSAAVKLNSTLVSGGDVSTFLIAPGGLDVVYSADQTTDNRLELFRAPIDGSASPVKLSGPLVAGGVFKTISVAPGGSRVVYIADQNTYGVDELFSVALAGGPVCKLNPPLVASGDVLEFSISPDSQSVLYLADQDTNDVVELFRVKCDGSVSAQKISGPLVAGGDVGGPTYFPANLPRFLIGSDSSTVVFRADKVSDDVIELFSVVQSQKHVPHRRP